MSDAVIGYYDTDDPDTQVKIYTFMEDACYDAQSNPGEDLVGEHCKAALTNVIDSCKYIHLLFGGLRFLHDKLTFPKATRGRPRRSSEEAQISFVNTMTSPS